MSVASEFSKAQKEWKDAKPRPPEMTLCSDVWDDDGNTISDVATVSNQGSLVLERRIISPHGKTQKVEEMMCYGPEEALALARFISEVFAE